MLRRSKYQYCKSINTSVSCCWLPRVETLPLLSGRWWWRLLSWGPVQEGKIKERKRAQKAWSQARSFPQVPFREMSRVGRTAEEVFCGVRRCPAGGTEVIWEPAHPQQEAVREEQKPEWSWESVDCKVGRAEEGGFLFRHRRCLVLQDSVIRRGDATPACLRRCGRSE